MVKVRKLYVNMEASLLIEASFTFNDKLLSCGAKKVSIETCEMDTICIDGNKYYDLGEVYGELMEIREMGVIRNRTMAQNHSPSHGIKPQACVTRKELEDKWDAEHKRLWYIYADQLTANTINQLADIVVAHQWGLSVEDLDERMGK